MKCAGQTVFDLFSYSPWAAASVETYVLVLYLDDSDNPSGPTLGIGGYVTLASEWQRFERAAEPFLNEMGVSVLRGKDFHNRHGSFKGWSGEKKLSFVRDLYDLAKRFHMLGAASVVEKAEYKELRKIPMLRNMSPLGAAFASTISNMVMKELAGFIEKPGYRLSVVVESGNRNNGNLVKYFSGLKKSGPLGDFLGNISFVEKNECRAVQLSDFLAFHFRRASEGWAEEGFPPEIQYEPALNAMVARVRHRFNAVHKFPEELDFSDGIREVDSPLIASKKGNWT